jgi:hypothetical protein
MSYYTSYPGPQYFPQPIPRPISAAKNAALVGAIMGAAGLRIRTVRVNLLAGTIILEYDGKPATKSNLLSWCQQLTLENCPQVLVHKQQVQPPDIGGVMMAGLTMLAVPFLKQPLKAILTYFTIAPTLAKATTTLATRGVKVEVLDGIAVGLAA